ncbi:hypothetical protein [Flavobacterium fluviatile]|uniref:hypothetical protein n=1 Tax=Flavobacterium fluviatile TaxID=1862387 RepID=UPI0013D0BF97|nr:hypothetical protein [Flavobacterium fluviatile]
MTQQQNPERIIYLDEDEDDERILFLEAAAELKLPISIVQTADGNELLQPLKNAERHPDFIFLNINMP